VSKGDIAFGYIDLRCLWECVIFGVLSRSEGLLRFLQSCEAYCTACGSGGEQVFFFVIGEGWGCIILVVGEELGGGKEYTFSFRWFAISTNVYFQAKSCKVAVDESHQSVNKCGASWERECSVIDVE
jgi:hypothetical protein